MCTTFNRRPGLAMARGANVTSASPRFRARALSFPTTPSFAAASPFATEAGRQQPVALCLAAWRRKLFRLDFFALLLAVMAALTSPRSFAQNPPVLPFKLQTTSWYIQAGVVVNPAPGTHVFANPPAGPGLWCTPAEMILNGTESVRARDYPLCPDAAGGLERTRHDSAPHADDEVPSVPWAFDITCPVPGGFGANETRVTGVRTHPGAGHQDRYMAVVGALRGTVPGPSLAPRFVIIHGSIGKHLNSPQPPDPAPIVGGSRLEPPCKQPSPADQDYPAGELLTLVDPASNRMLMLLVVEGASEANLGSVYVRDGTNGPIVADLRPLMQTQPLDASAVVFTVQDQPIPPSVVQVMTAGNTYIEVITTAHPDGKLVGALTDISSTSSYQVQLRPGWNVVANQLSRGGNTLAEVLPSVPPGSVVYKYDATNQNYSASTYDPHLSRWSNPTLALPPGEGVFIRNPSPAPYTITFVGEVLGDGRLDLPVGWTVLAARQVPAPATYEQITGQLPANGTKLYRYNTASQANPMNLTNWQEYVFSDGLWSPGTPIMLVAEPVFIQVPAAPIAPAILVQPQSQAVAAGSAVSFAVQATGTAPLTYQWSWNGQPIPGATEATLSLTGVQSAQAGAYSVTVANAAGSIASDPAQLQVNNPPMLVPLHDRTVHAGTSVVLQPAAFDMDAPNTHLTFSLGPDAPAGALLDPATGYFTWGTSYADENTTHRVTLLVTDDGLPPLSSTQTVTLTVVRRLAIQSVHKSPEALELRWNAIPGQLYTIESSPTLNPPAWSYLASVVAQSEDGVWTNIPPTVPPTVPPTIFYRVGVPQECDCGCRSMTFKSVKPTAGNAQFEQGIASVDVTVPFDIAGEITCTTGDPDKHCKGNVKAEVQAASFYTIDGARGNQSRVNDDKVTGAKLEPASMSVYGNCSQTKDWSMKATYKATLRLDSGLGTDYVCGTLYIKVTWECGWRQESRTVRIDVDGRPDNPVEHRRGGFDDWRSDYDGDGRDGYEDDDDFDPSK